MSLSLTWKYTGKSKIIEERQNVRGIEILCYALCAMWKHSGTIALWFQQYVCLCHFLFSLYSSCAVLCVYVKQINCWVWRLWFLACDFLGSVPFLILTTISCPLRFQTELQGLVVDIYPSRMEWSSDGFCRTFETWSSTGQSHGLQASFALVCNLPQNKQTKKRYDGVLEVVLTVCIRMVKFCCWTI